MLLRGGQGAAAPPQQHPVAVASLAFLPTPAAQVVPCRHTARAHRHHHLERQPRRVQAAVVQQDTDVAAPANPGMTAPAALHSLPPGVARVAARFMAAASPLDRVKLLIAAARAAPPLPDSDRVLDNRVMGCTAQVWVTVQATGTTTDGGVLRIAGGSDSELSAGVVAVLAEALSGLTIRELLELDVQALLTALQLPAAYAAAAAAATSSSPAGAPSRANVTGNVLEAITRRARALIQEYPAFPSLRITADAVQPSGAFAEVQAAYLSPDLAVVDALVSTLSELRVGVVAHFYMDPEVQGVLASAAERGWPHIAISDSLVMADTAVRMAAAGCTHIAVLGVDFMSENVRAILDEAGYAHVGVSRLSASPIGCSLAEAAEAPAYAAWLAEAAATTPRSLHVVYINTSLATKAGAHAAMPTITCTSSNVVQTVLAAFDAVPGATVWYGPDTYMGANLVALFASLAEMPAEEVAALAPGHTPESIAALLPRLHYYGHGSCIVHHLFGGEVCQAVAGGYGDAYLTAHFEVPGEMFRLASAARARGMGVVGSTSNILDFIGGKVAEAVERHGSTGAPELLRFVLGTESGMVTSIVRRVQALLAGGAGGDAVAVEIVFPVDARAITTPATGAPADLPGGLALLPGPALGGEGCSLAGGCASCPYMRMNTLAALNNVLGALATVRAGQGNVTAARDLLARHAPRAQGQGVAASGCIPILHMRHFQRTKTLPPNLVNDILTRHASALPAGSC